MTSDLTEHGYSATRHRGAIKQIQVLGERCSGTNYVTRLMQRNTDYFVNDVIGWKHGFMQAVTIPSDTLLIVASRNVTSWIKSLYLKPWHATRPVQEASFSEFIRMPFKTCVDKKRYFDNARLGDVIQQDRNPMTGLPFDNPFAMRAAKYDAFLGLPHRGCNVVLTRFETVLADPEAFLAQVSRDYDLTREPELRPVKKRAGSRFQGYADEDRELDWDAVSDEDRAFIELQSRSDIERRLGYLKRL